MSVVGATLLNMATKRSGDCAGRVLAYAFKPSAIQSSADLASSRGQRSYLRLSAIRFIALIVGAVAAGLRFLGTPGFDFQGLVLLLAFAMAALAEIWLIWRQPERSWYAGRAVAESAKTLAWRYVVKGEPFGGSMSDEDADVLLNDRTREVLDRGKDQIDLNAGDAVITASMRELRQAGFDERRRTYIEYRTIEQRTWYSEKARCNERLATVWRFVLLAAELLAVVIAAIVLGQDVPLDVPGLIAVAVASGAAWVAIKQYSPLTSAYRVAATELALQEDLLLSIREDDWAQAVADAEEAISREHTMWLASRGPERLR